MLPNVLNLMKFGGIAHHNQQHERLKKKFISGKPFKDLIKCSFLISGPSVLAGLAVMIILIPLNGWIANLSKKLQVKQMKNKDERVKLMNEILNGIKVLKLYAWEPSFQKFVTDIRDKEIKVLTQSAYLNAGTSFIWTCAPFVVSFNRMTSFAS